MTVNFTFDKAAVERRGRTQGRVHPSVSMLHSTPHLTSLSEYILLAVLVPPDTGGGAGHEPFGTQ